MIKKHTHDFISQSTFPTQKNTPLGNIHSQKCTQGDDHSIDTDINFVVLAHGINHTHYLLEVPFVLQSGSDLLSWQVI